MAKEVAVVVAAEVLAADVAILEANVVTARAMGSKLAEFATIEITTDAERDRALEVGKEAKGILNTFEDGRVKSKASLLYRSKNVDDYAKALSAPLETALTTLRESVKKYNDEQEVIRAQKAEAKRLEQEKLREQEAETQAQLERERQAAVQKVIDDGNLRRQTEIDAMPPGPEKAAAIRELKIAMGVALDAIDDKAVQDSGHVALVADISAGLMKKEEEGRRGHRGTGTVKRWAFEVVDQSLVPEEYKEVVASKVNKAITGEAGLREIPGLRVFQDSNVRF